jgi:hypothetical protein
MILCAIKTKWFFAMVCRLANTIRTCEALGKNTSTAKHTIAPHTVVVSSKQINKQFKMNLAVFRDFRVSDWEERLS